MKAKLVPPCAYLGGKQRLASQIVDVILSDNPNHKDSHFYDLCCGSGAISIELINRGISPEQITMVDMSPWGLFWRDIGNGNFSCDVFNLLIENMPSNPEDIQAYVKQLYNQPPNDGLLENAVYKFLILQSASFGSKPIWLNGDKWSSAFFRNYWTPTETSNRRSPVNPMMPMPKTLYQRVESISHEMRGITGICQNVYDLTIPENSIVYIDPPYKGTTGYGFDLDYVQFTNRQVVPTYISEGYRFSEHAVLMSDSRRKGGVSGERKSENQEWLNKFNVRNHF